MAWKLLKRFDRLYKLPKACKQHIKRVAKETHIAKGDFFLKLDDEVDDISFVESGLLRSYWMKDGHKITHDLYVEMECCTPVKSWYCSIKSEEEIQAIEDTVIITLPLDDIVTLGNTYMEFRIMISFHLWSNWGAIAELNNIYRFCDEKGRYDWFRANYASDTFERVPAQYLAEFIGVDQEMFNPTIT